MSHLHAPGFPRDLLTLVVSHTHFLAGATMSDDLAELLSDLFFDVKYYLTPTLSPNVIANVALTLSKNGGVAASSLADVTHIITNTIRFEGWRDAKKGAAVVTVRFTNYSVYKIRWTERT